MAKADDVQRDLQTLEALAKEAVSVFQFLARRESVVGEILACRTLLRLITQHFRGVTDNSYRSQVCASLRCAASFEYRVVTGDMGPLVASISDFSKLRTPVLRISYWRDKIPAIVRVLDHQKPPAFLLDLLLTQARDGLGQRSVDVTGLFELIREYFRDVQLFNAVIADRPLDPATLLQTKASGIIPAAVRLDLGADWGPWEQWLRQRVEGILEPIPIMEARIAPDREDWPPDASARVSIREMQRRVNEASRYFQSTAPVDPVELPDRIIVPEPVETAARFTRSSDGRIDISVPSPTDAVAGLRQALARKLARELPKYVAQSNQYGDLISELEDFEASLREGTIWDVWIGGNSLRHEREINANRELDRDPDHPPLPHGLAGLLEIAVEGNNTIIDADPEGRKLDAARPTPAERAAAGAALQASAPVLAEVEHSLDVFTERSVAQVAHIVHHGHAAQSGGGLGAEQAALVAVGTLANAQQSVVKSAANEINSLSDVEREEIKALLRDAFKAAQSQNSGEGFRSAFSKAYAEKFGEIAATWTGRITAVGVVSIAYVLFNGPMLSTWFAGADMAGFRLAIARILEFLKE